MIPLFLFSRNGVSRFIVWRNASLVLSSTLSKTLAPHLRQTWL